MSLFKERVLELMDEGVLDPQDLAEMALLYMSDAAVEDMCRDNDILHIVKPQDEAEEELEQDPLDDFNYVGSRHHY